MFGVKTKAKQLLAYYWNYMVMCRKFARNGGMLGKPLAIGNPKYIAVGKNVRIKKGARIECYDCFAGYSLKPELVIGNGVIINYRFSCFVADAVHIGKDTIIAGDVMITSENHGIAPESDIPYHAQPLTTAPVSIGEGCWIGEKAMILPGVTVGNKCVIAAGAVVTKDVPDYSIVAGVPGKVIKRYDMQTHSWISC